MERTDVFLHVPVMFYVYERDMELLILSWSFISVFHCKAVGSELSFDTYSEFRWISLADILNFKKPTWTKFQSVSNSVIIL